MSRVERRTTPCSHPPREWLRGALLPCANPACRDTSPGDTYSTYAYNQAGEIEMVIFERFVRHTEDGPIWTWERERTAPTKRKGRK